MKLKQIVKNAWKQGTAEEKIILGLCLALAASLARIIWGT